MDEAGLKQTKLIPCQIKLDEAAEAISCLHLFWIKLGPLPSVQLKPFWEGLTEPCLPLEVYASTVGHYGRAQDLPWLLKRSVKGCISSCCACCSR